MSSGLHKKSAFFLDFFNIFFNYLNKNAVSSIIYQYFKVFIGEADATQEIRYFRQLFWNHRS